MELWNVWYNGLHMGTVRALDVPEANDRARRKYGTTRAEVKIRPCSPTIAEAEREATEDEYLEYRELAQRLRKAWANRVYGNTDIAKAVDAIDALLCRLDAHTASNPTNVAQMMDAQLFQRILHARSELGRTISDPMWADHAEVSKAALKRWHSAIDTTIKADVPANVAQGAACIERVRTLATDALSQYSKETAAGGEPAYPQWIDDVFVVVGIAELTVHRS